MPNPLTALSVALLFLVVVALMFWPDQGLFYRWRRARHMSKRVLREDALKHFHRAERGGRHATVQGVAGDLQVTVNAAAELLADMQQRDLLAASNGDLVLTPAGRDAALHIIRAHRLWERYLADRTGYDQSEWHEQAERLEHDLRPADLASLSTSLGNPTYDPHGDPIPTASGEMVGHGGKALTALEPGALGRIVHLEDEPEIVYAQLAAEGLHPGMEIQVLERTPQRVRFWADGDEHVLAPLLATNISVRAVSHDEPVPPAAVSGERLAGLLPGEIGEVVNISRACRSSERRRLMDLGILPGARIEAAFVSAGGDPTAYRVRDTLIALRDEQAGMIGVRRVKESDTLIKA